jgi:hypothetical protein
MKMNHRIARRADDPFWKRIDALGLGYDAEPNALIWVLNITEDAPEWPAVARLAIGELQAHLVTPIFSASEISAAEWLILLAQGHHGYPMPDDDFGYRETTYDPVKGCRTCGVGMEQNAPFRFRTDSMASRSDFLQLNWVFDEFFLRPEAASVLAREIDGFSGDPVVLHKKNRVSQQLVQMRISTVLPPAIDVSAFNRVTCKHANEESRGLPPTWQSTGPYCGAVKYNGCRRWPIRVTRSALLGAPDVVKSAEWVGSGGSAWRYVLVSRRFRQVVTRAGWRGISFEPVELLD